MDDNFLRNIGYFAVPNNQTLNPVDESGDASGLPASSIWDEPNLAAAGLGRGRDTSSGAPSLSLDSLAPSTGSLNPYSPMMSTSSMFSQNPRSIISPRVSRRDGHERKRSRLNTETTPFDSVDYWIQFDQEQQQQQMQKQQQQQQQQQQLLLQQQQLQQLQQQQLQLQQAQRQRQQQQQLKQQQKRKEKQSEETANAADATTTASSAQVKTPTPQRSATMTSQTLSTGRQKPEEVSLDDTALEKALSDEGEEGFSYSSIDLADQLSKIDSIAPTEVPQREGLYSTPLSWERPQMGLRLDSMLGLQTPTLSEAEQRRLIAIAMNPTPMGGLGNTMGPNFNSFPMFGPGLGTASLGQLSNNNLMSAMMAPSVSTGTQAQPSSSSSTQPAKQAKTEKGKEKLKTADRTAHNDIERKYRTNLKDRIAELRDAVPALRTIPENSVDDGDGEGEGSNQAGRGPKVSKGTVLTKATDYIHHLEKKNKAIMQQHQELSRRLQAFEQLLNATARPAFQMPNYSRTLFDPRAFC
ncbi:hypothetical protein SCUCBS95973_002058 [Sporothrix curviconia]|uniref:BHLH domain-containing protein n=1 Tax=Sporothrix curviconia TaxID=1260050 RepID=A0ABP0B3M3_9PEZI